MYIFVFLIMVRLSEGEEVNFAHDSGRIEIQHNGDYFEVVIDAEQGHVYHVCSIKNHEGENLMNEGVVMDLGTAFDKIPGFLFGNKLLLKYNL